MKIFNEAPAVTTPKGAKSGFAHPQSYARGLNDCCTTISKEHYHTKAILKLLPDLILKGVAWLKPGESKRIPAETFAAKILCKRHNSALSGLDAAATDFFSILMKIDKELKAPTGRDIAKHGLSGVDFERWMLKVMIGSLYCGNSPFHNGRSYRGILPPLRVVERLFSQKAWPQDWGWYMLPYAGQKIEGPVGMALRPFARDGDDYPRFFELQIMGHKLILCLRPELRTHPDALFRPVRWDLNLPLSKEVLAFDWPEGARA